MAIKTDYRLMHVKSIADSAILSTFTKLPVVIKIFGLNIFYLYTMCIEQHKRHTIIYSLQMGFRRKSLDLYESVSHSKYHFTHFIEI